ncbi:MAG TPA: DUF6496 domain-containing protein [Bryobacteraceae bacterium]|nr:DUF6496 domain-containing protein [Bryobacteraceae bacterium]
MPEKKTIKRAREDAREGQSPSTQAGEFVREEIEHVREGKHGARNTKQAIAIGLSKARRAGVKLPPSKNSSEQTRAQARRDTEKGESGSRKTSATRSRATSHALKREGHESASSSALSRQARTSARHRTSESRSRAARKAARTRAKRRS